MGDTEAREGFDNFYSICGFLGGLIFAVSLLPQLWKTYSSKSTTDLSYFWQIAYLLGLAGQVVYCIPYQLWPILAPGVVDFALMAILTGLKIYYDNIYSKRTKPGVKEITVGKVDISGIDILEPFKAELDDGASKRICCLEAQGHSHSEAQCLAREQGQSDQYAMRLRTGQQAGTCGPNQILAHEFESLEGVARLTDKTTGGG